MIFVILSLMRGRGNVILKPFIHLETMSTGVLLVAQVDNSSFETNRKLTLTFY